MTETALLAKGFCSGQEAGGTLRQGLLGGWGGGGWPILGVTVEGLGLKVRNLIFISGDGVLCCG